MKDLNVFLYKKDHNPSVVNDISMGYKVGGIWVNTTTKEAFIHLDSGVWSQISLKDELDSLTSDVSALEASVDDLIVAAIETDDVNIDTNEITTATISAGFTYEGLEPITETGITLSNDNWATYTDYPAIGVSSLISVDITGLEAGTTYKAKAYVIALGNKDTSANSVEFTTYNIPEITTDSVTSIEETSVTVSGTHDYIGTVEEAGIEYSTDGQDWTVDASAVMTSPISVNVVGLTADTTYSTRAYIVVDGVSYYAGDGETLTFTTKAAPVVTTIDRTVIGQTTATLEGSFTNDGGVTLTEVGVSYSADGVSYTDVAETGTTSPMSVDVSGLTADTLYYTRAYVNTASGNRYYGAVEEFTTTV